MTLFRRSLILIGGALVVLLVAAAGGFGALQTATGQAWLAKRLSGLLSSDAVQVEIAGIDGSVPFDMRVRQIRLADGGGTWLTIENTALKIAPRDLLSGQLTIRQLAIQQIAMTRRPASGPEAGPKDHELPSLPLTLAVDALEVQRIHLAKAVLGEPVTATLSGKGRIGTQAARAQLALTRVDGQSGHAKLDFDLTRSGQLALSADVTEPSGHVLQSLLGRPERVPFTLTVDGAGRIDGWAGTVTARAGDLARLESDLSIEFSPDLHVTMDGELDADALLPANAAPLMPRPVSFKASAVIGERDLLIETLDLDTGAVTLRTTGRVDRIDRAITGEAHAAAPDLAPFASLLGTTLSGAASADLTVKGPLDAPALHIALSGRTMRVADMRIESLSAALEASPHGPWRVTGNGALNGIAPIGDAPVDLPRTVTWTIDGTADADLTAAQLRHLAVQGGAFTLEASGQVASLQDAPAGSGTVRVRATDLTQLRALSGLPLTGALDLEADIRAQPSSTLAATLRGRAAGLSTGEAALDALLGPTPDLVADIARTADGAITIDGARLTGTAASITGRGAITPDVHDLTAQASVTVPDLAPLSAAAGAALTGRLTADLNLSGRIAAPSLAARVTAPGLGIDRIRLDQMTAAVNLPDATRLGGMVDATFKAGAIEGRATAQVAHPRRERIEIAKLSLMAAGTTLDGALSIALDRPRLTGTLTGHSPDLSRWSALAGVALAGSGDLGIKLAAADGQSASVSVTAQRIAVGHDARAEHVRLNAQLTNLFGNPTGHASLALDSAGAAEIHAERVRMEARSSAPGTFVVTTEATGTLSPAAQPTPFRLAMSGDVQIGGGTERARIARLDATIGGNTIVGTRPFAIARSGKGIRIENAALRVGSGTITAAGTLGDQLAFTLAARDLPLAILSAFAPERPLSGRLSAEIDLSGTARAPVGRLDVAVDSLRLVTGRDAVPPLGLSLQAAWRGARIEGQGRVDGPGGSALTLAIDAPLHLDPGTFALSMPQDRPMRITARGGGQLESWAPALPLGEDRIAGRFELDAVIEGTPKDPQAGGRLVVTNGRYVNFIAGTDLHEVALEIAGDGRHFTLRRFSAHDGGKGTISAQGAIDLSATPGPVVDITARFTGFQAVRRDDATATADGELRFAGTLSAADLSGRIRIQRAEVRIPEKLPHSVAQLDVIEVDSRSGTVVATPDQARETNAFTLRLDIGVESPGRVFLRGRGAESEWRGDLTIKGTSDHPEIVGTLTVVRGHLTFLGKGFDLTQGTIRFDGGARINPQVNVVAEHRSADIVAQAVVTGTVINPTLTLTSQPELPRDEILSRVLFGRSASQITAAQGLQLAQAAAALASGQLGLMERLRESVGLDQLNVSSEVDPATGQPTSPSVTAGKYIGNGVFVGVEQGATSDSTRTKVEIEIAPNVTIQSEVGIDSSAGVGLNWRWDY